MNMVDPLSIASVAAGLLTLGIQVTQYLVAFYSVYKDQDTDLAKITKNFENLQGIFRSLQTTVQDYQSRADAEELLQQVDQATQRCQDIIAELKIECEKFQKFPVTGWKGHVQVAGRRAAYPFRKSTLQKLEEDVGEIRENLSFALNVLQLKHHSQVHYDISELKSELNSRLERINNNQIFSMIRVWLMAPDAYNDQKAMLEKRHPRTGLWFVHSHYFTNWLVECNSFLWINGFAGCGKSVLCSTAIQQTFRKTEHAHGVGIGFFYFSFNDESKQNDQGMLRALLLQLSAQLPDGDIYLEELYKVSQRETPTAGVLLDSLRSVISRFREVFILLDALDESPRDYEREDVLRGIETIRKWGLPSLHLLVTSRNDLDIRESLNPSPDQVLWMKNPEIDRDIARFVSNQLNDDPKLQRWKALHSDIQAKLTQRAQGG